MFSYYFDPTYVLVIIAFLLTLFASMGVKSTFSKYNDVRSSRGITAASAARQILDANGLQNIRIRTIMTRGIKMFHCLSLFITTGVSQR